MTTLYEKVGPGLVFDRTESEEEPKMITMTVTIKGKTFSGSCPRALGTNNSAKEAKKRAAATALADLYCITYPQE